MHVGQLVRQQQAKDVALMWQAEVVCRCLGDLPFKSDGKEVVDCTPEMRRIELQPGDSAVVMATDGLWDVLSDTDVVSIVTKVRAPPLSWSSCEYTSP